MTIYTGPTNQLCRVIPEKTLGHLMKGQVCKHRKYYAPAGDTRAPSQLNQLKRGIYLSRKMRADFI